LESQIFVAREPEVVGRYLGDVSNVAKWDRGVGEARVTSDGAMRVGAEFETVGLAGARDGAGLKGRMGYRVAEAEGNRSVVELTSREGNARFFRRATWEFRIEKAEGGSTVICVADFEVRWRYWFMAPVLFFMKGAIHRDLEGLKRAVEAGTEAAGK
jgi:Polyketide cyclase / dehydrase and lipid transport